jgi:hypothetical protein
MIYSPRILLYCDVRLLLSDRECVIPLRLNLEDAEGAQQSVKSAIEDSRHSNTLVHIQA